ncbi:MAG: alpha-E domain-containing protein [Fimbriiglobus sp.]
MISRVAEHCFWLARYLERAENTARLLEVNHTLLLDFHVPMEQQWRPLLIISGIHEYDSAPTAENVQDHLTWDAENPCSITSSLAAARENGRIIREVISAEMWERLNYYHLWMQSPAARASYGSSRTDFYSQIRRINQLVHGIADGTMAHGEAWEFFRLGMYLERASQTARILDVKYHTLLNRVEDVNSPTDNAHWVAILMSCSGYEPFHKRPRLHTTDPGTAVAEFLILDEQFPRSVRWCITRSRHAASVIANAAAVKGPPTLTDERIEALLGWLSKATIQQIVKDGLHEGLTHVVNSVHEIGDAVYSSYFDFDSAAKAKPAPAAKAAAKTQTQSQA